MGPEGSLLCSQQPAIGPYPEPDASSPYLPTLFPWDTSRMNTKFLSENMRGRDHMEDLGIDGRIMLKWVLR
jgi:hypothetical protein